MFILSMEYQENLENLKRIQNANSDGFLENYSS